LGADPVFGDPPVNAVMIAVFGGETTVVDKVAFLSLRRHPWPEGGS